MHLFSGFTLGAGPPPPARNVSNGGRERSHSQGTKKAA